MHCTGLFHAERLAQVDFGAPYCSMQVCSCLDLGIAQWGEINLEEQHSDVLLIILVCFNKIFYGKYVVSMLFYSE